MENEKDKATELLKHFDSVFETETFKHIIFNDMKLLQKMFELFEYELYKPSPVYEKLRQQHIKLSDRLEKSFTKEQEKMFEEFMEIGNKMLVEENEQLFYFGFILAKEIEKESKIDNKETNK